VRDRAGEGPERIRFCSAILPPYARRTKSLEVLIPILYLEGVSTGDFEEALVALLGKDAGGLSASTIGRLKDAWSEEHVRWSRRDLSARRYVYFWADGIHVQAPEGEKELVGLIDGVRESAQSWRELLLDLKRRGLAMAPELAVADGALGFSADRRMSLAGRFGKYYCKRPNGRRIWRDCTRRAFDGPALTGAFCCGRASKLRIS